jgi:hypothetical protein
MTMQKRRNFIALVLALILALSCRFFTPSETPAPVTPTDDPVQTEPPTVTLTVPTETPAPSETPAPTRLNPTGPYLLYGGTEGIWISNPDGSFLTRITDLPIGLHDLRRAVSPQGDRLALIVSDEAGALDLVMVAIPSGETQTIARLYEITNDEITENPTSARAFTAYAIRDYDNVAWQPGEGRFLAFMGAIEGSTSDLYLYDTESEEITQLTDGPSQGVFPIWSPNGEYILHYGVSWKGPFGGAILGHDHLDGVWSVRVEDEAVITMPAPKSVALNFAGWQDDTHYITYDDDANCDSTNLRSVDVTSGKTTQISDLSFYAYIARSPENGALLFSGAEGCTTSPGEGIFLLLPDRTSSAQLADKRAWGIEWLPESSIFYAYPEALFSSDGARRYDPPVYDKSFHPALSQKGYQAWEVIENRQGRVMVKASESDWQAVIEDVTVEKLIWDPISGETLLIVLRDGALYAASAPDFAPRPMGEVPGATQAVWLP